MERLKRCVCGGHGPAEIRWHLALLMAGYWGLVFCAWLGYPAENHFSVQTRMLSALGSFEDCYNPRWYWLFTAAMVYCGMCMVPVILYMRRRLSPVSGRGATAGACFFLLGCGATMLTGLLPYAHRDVLGWQLSDLHMNAAALLAGSFALGFGWHGLLLLRAWLAGRPFGPHGPRVYLRFVGPFLLGVPVLVALALRIRWGSVWAAACAAAGASGKEAAGFMSAAFGGMVHFPLLEHIAIWTLTVFVVWFTVVLPHPDGEVRTGRPAHADHAEQ